MKKIRDYILEYNQLNRECDSIYHAAALKLGLSDCAFYIYCMLIDSEEPCKQSDLSDGYFMSRQTVNSSLKKLEKEGCVELIKIEGKKGKTIHLTEKGEAFVQKNIRPVLEAEERACNRFTEEETEAFIGLYRKLVDSLRDEIETL